MIIPRETHQAFVNYEPYCRFVGKLVRDTIEPYCNEHHFAFVDRFKDEASVAEKIETGRITKWSDLDDLYGCCIVVPTLVEEPEVVNWLQKTFEQVDLKGRKTTQKDPGVFRFDATRFVGILRPLDGINRVPEIERFKFEIQIRTAFEHAWSVTTHALTYKSDIVSWKRLRLAAQLKAAVEQIDLLIVGFDSASELISESRWGETKCKFDIVKKFQELRLPEELHPKDWSRFADNLYALLSGIPRARGESVENVVERALRYFAGHISLMPQERIPRSLSLLQFVCGVLADGKLITQGLYRYTPHITSELKSIFDVRVLGIGFSYDGLAGTSPPPVNESVEGVAQPAVAADGPPSLVPLGKGPRG